MIIEIQSSQIMKGEGKKVYHMLYVVNNINNIIFVL